MRSSRHFPSLVSVSATVAVLIAIVFAAARMRAADPDAGLASIKADALFLFAAENGDALAVFAHAGERGAEFRLDLIFGLRGGYEAARDQRSACRALSAFGQGRERAAGQARGAVNV